MLVDGYVSSEAVLVYFQMAEARIAPMSRGCIRILNRINITSREIFGVTLEEVEDIMYDHHLGYKRHMPPFATFDLSAVGVSCVTCRLDI